MFAKGNEQFVPFVFTVLGVVFTDLLIGVSLGIFAAVVYLLKNDFKNPYTIIIDDAGTYRIEMAEQVTFINKASAIQLLSKIPENLL